MTVKEIEKNKAKGITIKEALTEAWYSGQSYMIGSHEDFRQTHASRDTVVKALMERINLE